MRVLLAEDHSDTRTALRIVFERAGWEVLAAEDGREALYLYHLTIHEERYFDAVLLDVQMPRLNGFAVGMNVRNLEKYGDVRRATLIFLTGHDDVTPQQLSTEDLKKILEADAYIRKPIDPVELI